MNNENFETKDPKYTENIKKITSQTKASHEELNQRFQPIVENEAYLKEMIEKTQSSSNTQIENINQSISNITNNIGNSNNADGSTTSGSIFAKLNMIISKIAEMLSWWTQERAIKQDCLDVATSTRASQTSIDTLKNNINDNLSTINTNLSHNAKQETLSTIQSSINNKIVPRYKIESFDIIADNTEREIININGKGILVTILANHAISSTGISPVTSKITIDNTEISIITSNDGCYKLGIGPVRIEEEYIHYFPCTVSTVGGFSTYHNSLNFTFCNNLKISYKYELKSNENPPKPKYKGFIIYKIYE